MSGEDLKKRLEASGYSPARMYKLLSMSSQAYNQAMKSVDVKSGFLERICEVTGETMAFFYPQHFEASQTFRAHNISKGNVKIIEHENDQTDLLNDLRGIINELREDKHELKEKVRALEARLAREG